MTFTHILHTVTRYGESPLIIAMSKKYIEVVGEGSYQECPEQVVLDVELSVRSAKEESAGKRHRKIADTLVNELLA
ncbi:hypothetical protein ACSYAD_25620, partial [Acaryochloris marina NIES-2412]